MRIKKIILTKEDIKNLMLNKTISIEREDVWNVPKSSIVYGVGCNGMFDKVDYRWVYGDTDQYITDKKNVGRRAEDYPNNEISSQSGCLWWDFNKHYSPFNKVGETVINGKKNPIKFKIENIIIDKLTDVECIDSYKQKRRYHKIIFKIDIKIIE